MKALYVAEDGTEIILSYPGDGRFTPTSYIPMRDRRPDSSSHSMMFRYAGDGKCSSKIAHGPGHQSTSTCEAIGTHDEHFNYSLGYSLEWTDKDVRPDSGVAFAD